MEKFKQYKKTLIITLVITLLPMIIGLVLWDKLPDQVATHFGANGEANGWSSKLFAVVGLPLFIGAAQFLSVFATLSDPKKKKIDPKMLKLVFWICPIVSWFGAIATYGYALGWNLNMERLVFILLGAIFVAVGNYLPKCRQNYTVGIKLPWTLDDEENWNQTHRFGGRVWMLGGIAVLILGITGIGGTWIMFGLIMLFSFAPMVYSYMYYMKHRKAE